MEANRWITLLGDAAKELLFVRLQGHEGIGQAFEYTIDALSEDLTLDLSAVLGQSLAVRIEQHAGGRRYIHGVVTQFQVAGTEGRYARYRIALSPALAVLRRRINCRIFQARSAPEIIKAILHEHGFVAVEDRLHGSYPPIEYFVQYRESDFDVLHRLMAREGIYYYFVHAADRHTLVLADAPSSHDAAEGYDHLPFRGTGERAAEVEHVREWSSELRLVSGACVLRDFNFERPATAPTATLSRPTDNAHGGMEVYDFPGRFAQSSAGDARATLRLEQAQVGHRRFEGTGEIRGLFSGALFSLAEHPRGDQNREYLVISAELELSANPYESGGGEPSCSYRFAAIPSDGTFRMPEVQGPHIDGPQTAMVVGPANEEIWTDKYGRVKLQFHWDRYGESDEKSSCWVRVSQAWAGGSWGSLHVPRIGQEVIVEFLEGDPERPIVTGRVYNAARMPPYKLPDMATRSGCRSRSTKGGAMANGNEIHFEDRKGEEDLFIQAERTQTTLVKGSQSVSVGGNRSVSAGGDESYSVDGSRTVTVAKNETATFQGPRSTMVTAPDALTIMGPHSGLYQSGRAVTVCGGDDALLVQGVKATKVDGKYDIKASAHYEVSQGGGTSLTLEDKCEIVSNGPVTLSNTKCQVTLDGDKITLSGQSEIALVCGGASLTLKKDGTIEIVGQTKVSISGGQGAIELAAGGATMSGPKATVDGSGQAVIQGAVVRIN